MTIPTIHVLLATYNGAGFLPPQWASLQPQEGVGLGVHLSPGLAPEPGGETVPFAGAPALRPASLPVRALRVCQREGLNGAPRGPTVRDPPRAGGRA